MEEVEHRKIIDMTVKVRFLRMHENYSIGELAAVLKINEARIFDLENGAYLAELQDVIRYCDTFGISYEDFLFNKFSVFQSEYLADEQKMLKAIGYKV